MVVYKDMVLTVLILAFTATCMADEMKSMKDEIAVIRNLLKVQTEKLTRLKMENDALKITVSKLENDNLLMKDRLMDISDENKVVQHEVTNLRRQVTQMQSLLKHGDVANLNEQEEPNGTLIETAIRRRLLLPDAWSPSTTPILTEPVAFYAYMSKPEPTPSNHHSLIFDVLKTNIGNGYNKFSGTFVAPSAGAYVFTWTINTNPNGAHWINLMVNNAIVGGNLCDTQGAVSYDSDSNTVVVVLSQGDSVNLRTTNQSLTDIYADLHAFTTFAGWRL